MKTHEKNPQFTNNLVGAKSPYLRQHAHNPVFWYPWGEEALGRAKAENKPILVSSGYSTCYWCHVMEREVFENVSIAALMNQHFINIKIDREEHPHLDEQYMIARQLMTHEGGWPNHVFLTPDLKPFYAGGTYAPDDRYGKPGFPRLLEWLHYAWVSQEADVRRQAEEITEAMRRLLVVRDSSAQQQEIGVVHSELLQSLRDHFDAQSGGFFSAPKFPHEHYLLYLLGQGEREMTTRTLYKMAAGGIYDHVGGGFHRYAVDKDWFVPHFEKMLYTQALLSRVYTEHAAQTGDPYTSEIAKATLDFVRGPFTHAEGGFFAAMDAETDGVEGAYYAWTTEEIQAALTEPEQAFFVEFFALADIPEFPGHKHTPGKCIIAREPLMLKGEQRGLPYDRLSALAGGVMNKLLAVRNTRAPIGLDDKIITGWNGLMIAAFARAYAVFKLPCYLQSARRAADYVLQVARTNDGLKRVVSDGEARIAATLEDYAYLAHGLLELAKMDPEYCGRAEEIISEADRKLWDETLGAYYMTEAAPDVLIRAMNVSDSALPSANAMMLHNFMALGWEERAAKLRASLLGAIQGKPVLEYATLLAACPAAAVAMREDAPVKFSATLSPQDAKPGSESEVIVSVRIAPGWHVYASPEVAPELMPLLIAIEGEGVADVLGWEWPKPQMWNGKQIYRGAIPVAARLKLAGGGRRGPIVVNVSAQPCNEGACGERVVGVIEV